MNLAGASTVDSALRPASTTSEKRGLSGFSAATTTALPGWAYVLPRTTNERLPKVIGRFLRKRSTSVLLSGRPISSR